MDDPGPGSKRGFFSKLLGKAEKVTEQDIRQMVDEGGNSGAIEDTQKEMINNIFEFSDSAADEIMTHRTEIVAVESAAPLSDIVKLSIQYGYSRIPVFEDDLDDIVGIAYIKDLLRYVTEPLPKTKKAKDIMREAFYVPKTQSLSKLFTDMNGRHIQMAVVVDEYGGTAGIVTLEDIIEAIVGNIQDEFDREDEDVRRVDDYTFIIQGSADIEDAAKALGENFPEGDYDTLGGFIMNLLGYIPEDGSTPQTDYEDVHFSVLEVKDKRIMKVRAEKVPAELADEASGSR